MDSEYTKSDVLDIIEKQEIYKTEFFFKYDQWFKLFFAIIFAKENCKFLFFGEQLMQVIKPF